MSEILLAVVRIVLLAVALGVGVAVLFLIAAGAYEAFLDWWYRPRRRA